MCVRTSCIWIAILPLPPNHESMLSSNVKTFRFQLTYDYKFDFEDEENKIPCLCGAPNCRKWMN